MAKLRKAFLSVLVMIFAIILCVPFAACGNKQAKVDKTENEGIEPFGLYTDLQFALNGENGQVTASVKNKFTLFPSTVTVYVDLYRSERYQEDCKNMIWVATNYIYDLDQGETVAATASTDGKQSFWKAKTTYRVDNGEWKEELSETVLFNADGLKKTVTNPISDKTEYFVSDFLQTNAGNTRIHIYPYQSESDYVDIPIYGTVSTSTGDVSIWFDNGESLKAVKDIFGEIKLDTFDVDNKSSEERQDFYLADSSIAPYSIYTELSEGSIARIYINDYYRESLRANLFVIYYSHPDSEIKFKKCFTASISEEIKQALIDSAIYMYESQRRIIK